MGRGHVGKQKELCARVLGKRIQVCPYSDLSYQVPVGWREDVQPRTVLSSGRCKEYCPSRQAHECSRPFSRGKSIPQCSSLTRLEAS